MINTAVIIGVYTVMDILGICQKNKNFVALRNFSIGVNGKPKMQNNSKTANRRANRTKIWDSGCYSAFRESTCDAQFLEFDLGPFGALCKISHFTMFKTLLLSQFSSDSSKLLYRLSHFWRSAKNCKNHGIFKFFLTQDHMQL